MVNWAKTTVERGNSESQMYPICIYIRSVHIINTILILLFMIIIIIIIAFLSRLLCQQLIDKTEPHISTGVLGLACALERQGRHGDLLWTPPPISASHASQM